jgi:peptidoglycan hydrolase CwlO-like protein
VTIVQPLRRRQISVVADFLHQLFATQLLQVVVGLANTVTAVEGQSKSGAGVWSESQTGIGVFGKGGRLAGHFDGSVEVTGSLTVQGMNVVPLLQLVQQLEQQLQQLQQQISTLGQKIIALQAAVTQSKARTNSAARG